MRTFFAFCTSSCLSMEILEVTISTRPKIFTPFIDEITEAVKPTLFSVVFSHSFWHSMYGPEPEPERNDNIAENMRGAINLKLSVNGDRDGDE